MNYYQLNSMENSIQKICINSIIMFECKNFGWIKLIEIVTDMQKQMYIDKSNGAEKNSNLQIRSNAICFIVSASSLYFYSSSSFRMTVHRCKCGEHIAVLYMYINSKRKSNVSTSPNSTNVLFFFFLYSARN